jgi:hypothetical protein
MGEREPPPLTTVEGAEGIDGPLSPEIVDAENLLKTDTLEPIDRSAPSLLGRDLVFMLVWIEEYCSFSRSSTH